MINNKKSPILDAEIEDYLANRSLNLRATTDSDTAYRNAEYVIIATPTNYDENKNYIVIIKGLVIKGNIPGGIN